MCWSWTLSDVDVVWCRTSWISRDVPVTGHTSWDLNISSASEMYALFLHHALANMSWCFWFEIRDCSVGHIVIHVWWLVIFRTVPVLCETCKKLERSQRSQTSANAMLFATWRHHIRFGSSFPYAPLKATLTKISKWSRIPSGSPPKLNHW